MHFLLVSPEVVVAREALPALVALEHPLAQVQHLVGAQALRAAEALEALGASVRPHARVLALVPLQVPRLAEALAAVGAQVRLLAGVRAQVHVQLAHVHEGLVAVRAAVGPHARVHALVLLEAVAVGEALAAVRAQIQDRLLAAAVHRVIFCVGVFLPAFGADVSSHRRRCCLLLLLVSVVLWPVREALRLGERQVLQGVVSAHVLPQVAADGEGERAVGAGEDLRRAVVLVAALDFLVLLQVEQLAEGLAADAARVRLGVHVRRPLVPLEEARLLEGGAAVGAPVRRRGASVLLQRLVRFVF